MRPNALGGPVEKGVRGPRLEIFAQQEWEKLEEALVALECVGKDFGDFKRLKTEGQVH